VELLRARVAGASPQQQPRKTTEIFLARGAINGSDAIQQIRMILLSQLLLVFGSWRNDC
jgi:hypothetical protein